MVYIAAWKNQPELLRLLVARGADVNQAKKNGKTPCYIACYNGHLEVVRLLVELGADVNQADDDGYTPCYIACRYGHLDVVHLLLDNGANPMIKNCVSRVCLYWLWFDVAC